MPRPQSYSMSPEDETWLFHDQEASRPESLFKNAAGRAAYDAPLLASQYRAQDRMDATRASDAFYANAAADRQATSDRTATVEGAENWRTSAGIQGNLALQNQRLAAQASEADQQRAVDYASLNARERQQYLDTMVRGYNETEDRNLRGNIAGAQLGQQSYEFNAAHQQRAYEFEADLNDRADRDTFDAAMKIRTQREAQDFQMREQQARYQLMGQLHEQELTAGERLRLQRLQGAIAGTNEAVQNGTLTAQEGQNMVATLKTGIDPLKERLLRSDMMHKQALTQQETERAAREASIAQMNLSFLGKSFAERIGVDEATGIRFFQKRPGEFEIIPDKTAERQAAQELKDQAQLQGMQKWTEGQNRIIADSRQHHADAWASADQKNRDRIDTIIKDRERAATTEKDPDRQTVLQGEAVKLRNELETNHDLDMRRHFQKMTGRKPDADLPIDLQFHQWLDDKYQLHPPPQLPQHSWNSPTPQQPQGDRPVTSVPGETWADYARRRARESEANTEPPPAGQQQPAAPQGPPPVAPQQEQPGLPAQQQGRLQPFDIEAPKTAHPVQRQQLTGLLDAKHSLTNRRDLAPEAAKQAMDAADGLARMLGKYGRLDGQANVSKEDAFKIAAWTRILESVPQQTRLPFNRNPSRAELEDAQRRTAGAEGFTPFGG